MDFMADEQFRNTMLNNKDNKKEKGTLYLVATPIGNLEDITLRALRVLEEVDLIACEDTRNTLKLLNHFNIKKPLVSYYENNKISRGNYLLEKLLAGENIALVSDAGTPGISDPGEDLVRLCIKNGINVTMCPGPVAAITGLVLSGLKAGRFVFEGFLPVNKNSRKKHLEKLKNEERTIVLYEAPHKLKNTLKDLYECLGDREIALCRELTKYFEEVKRGKISSFIEEYNEKSPRGEFVIVISGYENHGGQDEQGASGQLELTVMEHVRQLMDEGLDKKAAIKQVAQLRGMKKSDVYNAVVRANENQHTDE